MKADNFNTENFGQVVVSIVALGDANEQTAAHFSKIIFGDFVVMADFLREVVGQLVHINSPNARVVSAVAVFLTRSPACKLAATHRAMSRRVT